MAADDPKTTQDADGASGPPKQTPKGVVLGKDGKPSFAAWASKTRQQSQELKTRAPSDCPPDVEVLGRGTWTLLHSIAANYPEAPSRTQQADLSSFIGLLTRLYPCWVCAQDFEAYVRRDVPRVGSRYDFSRWLCQAHNDVNRKLGKPQFDCSRWDERWRTGWRDGRCD